MPIQFFKDGFPAREQKLWDSPWGKIGICICYDLSYTRVTDELVRLGANALIVPTMDIIDWGRNQHEVACARRSGAGGGIRLANIPSRELRHFSIRRARRIC